MKKLLIFPSSGNGLEAFECIDSSIYEFIGFIDDNPEKQLTTVFGYPVYSREILIKLDKNTDVLIVVGSYLNFHKRKTIIEGLQVATDQLAQVIHPKASVSKHAHIGKNVLIMAGTVITSNARVEDHCCILPNCVIHHDSVIQQYTLLAASVTVSGNSTIGENSYIGAGVTIKDGIKIPSKTLLGSGSNVVKSLEKSGTYFGNPATLK